MTWPNGTCNVPCSTRASAAAHPSLLTVAGGTTAVMLRPGDERVVGGCPVGSLAEPGAGTLAELVGLPGGDRCHVAAPARAGEDLGERDGFREGDDPRAERRVRPELGGPGPPAGPSRGRQRGSRAQTRAMFQAACKQPSASSGSLLVSRGCWRRRRAVRISGTSAMPISAGSSAVPSQRFSWSDAWAPARCAGRAGGPRRPGPGCSPPCAARP